MAAAFSMASLSAALPSVQTLRSPVAQTRGVRVARPVSTALPSFSGLGKENVLGLRTGTSWLSSVVDNGAKFFAMRHGRKIPRLGRPADQRKALLRGLTTELLKHGKLKTTKARARAMRKHVDHMITLAKGGSLHDRRQALSFLYDKELVSAMFQEVPDRFVDRTRGYTRIVRTMPRRGDNAPMCFIELV